MSRQIFGGMPELSSHYNWKLNKCFVEVSETTDEYVNHVLGVWHTRTVLDAFENRTYLDYTEHLSKGDRQILCSMTLLTGEQKACDSEKEFDALVKQ